MFSTTKPCVCNAVAKHSCLHLHICINVSDLKTKKASFTKSKLSNQYNNNKWQIKWWWLTEESAWKHIAWGFRGWVRWRVSVEVICAGRWCIHLQKDKQNQTLRLRTTAYKQVWGNVGCCFCHFYKIQRPSYRHAHVIKRILTLSV